MREFINESIACKRKDDILCYSIFIMHLSHCVLRSAPDFSARPISPFISLFENMND